MAGRIRRLNDRKDNLEEMLANTGNSGLLMMERRKALAEIQVGALTNFISGAKPGKLP